MECSGAVVIVGRVAAGIDRETEVQHQADHSQVASLGRGDERRPFGAPKSGHESGVGCGQAAGAGLVARDDRLEQPVHRILAPASEELDGRRNAGPEGVPPRRIAVGAGQVRVGAGGQQDRDRAWVSPRNRLHQRLRQHSGRAGSGVRQKLEAPRASGCIQRGDHGLRSHRRAPVEQQTDDRLVVGARVRARHSAFEWSPRPPSSAFLLDFGAGVEQQANDLGQPGRPCRIEMEARGAGQVQRAPAALGVDAHGGTGIAAQFRGDTGGVAEDECRRIPRLRQLGVLVQHPRGHPDLPVEAEAQEPHHVLRDRGIVSLDLAHQCRPARQTVLPRERQLRARQREWRRYRSQPGTGHRIAVPGCAQQFLGLAPCLTQVRVLRK